MAYASNHRGNPVHAGKRTEDDLRRMADMAADQLASTWNMNDRLRFDPRAHSLRPSDMIVNPDYDSDDYGYAPEDY